MQLSEYDAFSRELAQLCEAFNRPCTDELVQSYWRALHDLKLSEVVAGVQRVLVSGHDRFPKPWELREKPLSKATLLPENAVMHNRKMWEQAHIADPELARLDLGIARAARLLVREHEGSPQYAEALREDRQLRDRRYKLLAARVQAAT